MRRCEALLRIPTPEHASLNLAQAVLLVSHAFFEGARSRGARATGRTVGGRTTKETSALAPHDRRADLPDLEGLVQDLVTVLQGVGYAASRDKVEVTARAGLQRAQLSVREVGALRGMVKRLGG